VILRVANHDSEYLVEEGLLGGRPLVGEIPFFEPVAICIFWNLPFRRSLAKVVPMARSTGAAKDALRREDTTDDESTSPIVPRRLASPSKS